MYDVTIPSKRYPDLHYTGEDEPLYECALQPGDDELFFVHLFEEVAADEEAVKLTGLLLDQIDDVDAMAKQAFEQVISDENHPDYEVVRFFLDSYFDADYSEDELKVLFMTDKNPRDLSDVELLRLLKLRKVFTWFDGSDQETQGNEVSPEQYFSIDYMYNDDMTDEILTLTLNNNFEIHSMAHES